MQLTTISTFFMEMEGFPAIQGQIPSIGLVGGEVREKIPSATNYYPILPMVRVLPIPLPENVPGEDLMRLSTKQIPGVLAMHATLLTSGVVGLMKQYGCYQRDLMG
jgi:hypothetical protein